uniref:N-acetylaspartate synthetase n=1 Tax=Leptobrachium leishanense TaxID=445787 RepID=A0A8C5LWD8_9ANUR
MVCETKILAEDSAAIANPHKEPLKLPPAQVWPPASHSLCPPVSSEGDEKSKEQPYIREFQQGDQETVRSIFYQGIKERIPSSAFGGLRCQPLLQCLYAIMTVICFVVTSSLLLTCCVPVLVMGLRYYYSRKIILGVLECALRTDMSDIEQFYMKQPGSCFWVAVLDGKVIGIAAARGNEENNVVELRRMSVDANYRGKGIAKALGRKVVEFAMLNHYSSIVLGTTAVKLAAHKLYESLGFKHLGVIEHHTVPCMTQSIAERMFFQLRYHRYCLQIHEE